MFSFRLDNAGFLADGWIMGIAYYAAVIGIWVICILLGGLTARIVVQLCLRWTERK